MLCKITLHFRENLMLGYHLGEFADMATYNLPGVEKNRDGEKLTEAEHTGSTPALTKSIICSMPRFY